MSAVVIRLSSPSVELMLLMKFSSIGLRESVSLFMYSIRKQIQFRKIKAVQSLT